MFFELRILQYITQSFVVCHVLFRLLPTNELIKIVSVLFVCFFVLFLCIIIPT